MPSPTGIIGFSLSTPAARSGRILAYPQTDSASPIQHFTFDLPNHGQVETRTTTSESVGQADQGKLIQFSNAGATAVTLATPTDATFMCYVYVIGAGACTFTPASGTITYGTTTGAANVALAQGQDAIVFWDGTNWEMLYSNVLFQTNGTTNASQSKFNAVAGTGMTIVETPPGTVTFTVSGGSGGASAPYNDLISPASITPPVLSALTWGNQGSASAAYNAGGALRMQAPAGTGVDNNIILYKSTPATPYTLTVGLLFGGSNGPGTASLVFRESGTGKLITFAFGYNGGGASPPNFGLFKWNSYTSFNGFYFNSVGIWVTTAVWASIENDGTNLTWSMAVDGQNFKTIWQKSKTDFFTSGPDQAGIGLDNYTPNNITDAVFVHWAGI